MTAPPPTHGPDWWPDELTERQRVLLHAHPLFDLRGNDGVQPEDARHYDSMALALRVMELVLEASGLDDAITAGRVREALGPSLVAMDRDAEITVDGARHDRVVERVLGALRNDENSRHPFALEYAAFPAVGGAERRVLEFRLLEDAFHPDGRVVLQATTEGANLYLRALDHDLESQQAATEAVIELQLRRGRFQDAVNGARQAQRQSQRYGDQLRRRIEQTRRDLSRVDWRTEMPALLEQARIHLEARMETEDRLLSATDGRLEALDPGTESAIQVGSVRALLTECRRRHVELLSVVLGSRQTFLVEQARQVFVPVLLSPKPHLSEQVLFPMLGASVRDLDRLTERIFTLFGPPVPPPTLWLSELLIWQVQPPRASEAGDSIATARDLVDVASDPRHFDSAVLAAAESLLANLPSPTPLSALLMQEGVAGADFPLRELLVLRTLEQAAPDEPSERDGPPHASFTISRNGALESPEFLGDDLMISPVHAAQTPMEPADDFDAS